MRESDEPNKLKQCIGRQLLCTRNQMGKQQKELTLAAGFSISLLNKYESGETLPSLPNIKILADLFEIPVDQLLQDFHPDFIIYTIDFYLSKIDREKSKTIITVLGELINGK